MEITNYRVTRLAMAALAIALLVVLTAPALAHGDETNRHKYLVLHNQCEKVVGDTPCGRNIAHEGVKAKKGERPARNGEIAKSIVRLRSMIAAATAPEPASSPARSSEAGGQTAPTSTPQTGGGGGCTGMDKESGNSYSAVNSSSGAYGCYQIMPGTAAAHGCDLSTPGGQDACAGRICATQGPSAWTNSAGQNPCGRLGG